MPFRQPLKRLSLIISIGCQKSCVNSFPCSSFRSMAVEGFSINSTSTAPPVDSALPLLDFDWKLKYAVASGSIAAVNKPLLRLELYVSKNSRKVEEPTGVASEDQMQVSIAEFSKAELDALIGQMDAIEQALEEPGIAL